MSPVSASVLKTPRPNCTTFSISDEDVQELAKQALVIESTTAA